MCPDYDEFCEYFDKRCPMDCYGHGICLEKVEGKTISYQCFCLDGYDGADCVRFFPIKNQLGDLPKLPEGNFPFHFMRGHDAGRGSPDVLFRDH
jgi:hypothetical protein